MKRFISAMLIFSMVLLILSIPAYAAKKKATKQQHDQSRTTQSIYTSVDNLGTWFWNPWLIVEDKDSILNFMQENGYTEVYLQIDISLDTRYYRDFISSAAASGIKVFALSGNYQWIWQNKREEFYNFIKWVESYNLSVAENEKFQGIHLDIEPYLTFEWNTNRDLAILSYQNLVEDAVLQAARFNLPVVFDIPFWFDEIYFSNSYGTGNLAQWVISKASWTNIMAYRDSSQEIISISKNETDYARNLGKRLVISVETQSSSEGDNVTFFEEGLNYMYSELSVVKSYYQSQGYNNIGFAVHHLASIMNIK